MLEILLKENLKLNRDNKKALILNNDAFYYWEVERYIGKISSCINDIFGTKRINIGFFSHQSLCSYSVILFSLITGNTFIPIGNKLPIDNVKEILKVSNIDVLFINNEDINIILQLEEYLKNITIVVVDAKVENKLKNLKLLNDYKSKLIDNLLVNDKKDNVSYILFTSGSTGKPKGVQITQDNLNSFLINVVNKYDTKHINSISQTFELTFDLSLFCILIAFCKGLTLVVPSEYDKLKLVDFINNYNIDLFFGVPSTINIAFVNNILQKDSLPNLKMALFCGEPLKEKSLKQFILSAPNATIENLYGPTELTIFCSAYLINKNSIDTLNGLVSIGKTYDHLSYILLGDIGIVEDEGELCVSGPQRFKGYLNAKIDAFYNHNNDIYYKTGDIVKKDIVSNNLYFLKRKDQQVKINGYRVELYSVSYIIEEVDGISGAVTLEYNGSIYSYVIALESKYKEIMERLKQKLPIYATPKTIYFLTEFPYNSNGKIDIKKLTSWIKI